MEALKQRLVGRKTEDAATLKTRLDRVPMEMELGNRFDCQVVNDELTRAIREVQSIIEHHLSRN
jgi:guanylate kinase